MKLTPLPVTEYDSHGAYVREHTLLMGKTNSAHETLFFILVRSSDKKEMVLEIPTNAFCQNLEHILKSDDSKENAK